MPDLSFGNDGHTFIENTSHPRSFSILPNGKILVGNIQHSELSSWDFAILRLTEDGELDTSFGSQGKSITIYQGGDYVEEVLVQEDNKIIVVGDSRDSVGKVSALIARLTPDGDLDTSFGNNGIITHKYDDNPGQSDMVRSGLIYNNKLLVAGAVNMQFSNAEFFVARYHLEDIISSNSDLTSIDKSIEIYPNPGSEFIYISVEKELDNHQTFEIFDPFGKTVSQGIIKDQISKVDISPLSKGIYFIKINDPVRKTFLVKKIIKE